MMKRIFALMLAVGMFIISIPAQAFPAKTHNSHLETALFGEYGMSSSNPRAIEALTILENASYLCIDQFQGNGEKELSDLKFLKYYHIGYLPDSIDNINFTQNYSHRSYTHLGWNNDYSECNKGDTPNWSTDQWAKRREILLSSVEAVFRFNPTPDFMEAWLNTYDEDCAQFCELIYYIHVLGDHIYFDDYQKYSNTVKYIYPLSAFGTDPSIISELKRICTEIFGSEKCSSLTRALDTKDKEIRSLLRMTGKISSAEDFEKYQEYSQDVLDILSEHLPTLLKNEPFFQKVFYPRS